MKFIYLESGPIVDRIKSDLKENKNFVDIVLYRSNFDNTDRAKQIAANSFGSYMNELARSQNADRWVLLNFIAEVPGEIRGVNAYGDPYYLIGTKKQQDIYRLLIGLNTAMIEYILSKYRLLSGYNLETMLENYKNTRRSGILTFEIQKGLDRKKVLEKILKYEGNDLLILVKP